MKLLASASAAIGSMLVSTVALAQQVPDRAGREYPYDFGHMRGWGYADGWGMGYGIHPLGMVFGLLGIVLLVLFLIRILGRGIHGDWLGHGHGRHGSGSIALDILEERFAKGEIQKEEFEAKRQLLLRRPR